MSTVRIHLFSSYTGKIVRVQAIQACGVEEVNIHLFLTLTVCGGE